MGKKPTLQIALNPRQKVAELPVDFRKKGRFAEARKATHFSVKPPGARKALSGEIPKEFRRTIASRKQYIASQLIAWSKAETAKKLKTQRGKVKQAIQAKKTKAPSKAEKKRASQLAAATKAALAQEGFEKAPATTPRLDKKAFVSMPEAEIYRKRSGAHHDPRHADSFEGPAKFEKKELHIIKKKVEFDPSSPVEMYSFNSRATTVALREFLKPHAIKFLDEMRNQSDNAYIFRVETRNRIEGEPSRREGVGTERFEVRTSLTKQEIRGLKRAHPGLTVDELLRLRQIADMENEMTRLFDYFESRYKNYLSEKAISSMAVTGFSMEVVKGVMT
jgi:hypothetical protein